MTNYVPASKNKQVANSWKNSLNRLTGKTTRTGNPTRPRNGNGVTSDSYIGICKVVDISTSSVQKLRIADGFSDDYFVATLAGNLQINKYNFDLPAIELTIAADSLIYIESTLVGDPSTSAIAEIKLTTDTILTYEAGKEKTLISRVKFADSVITKFTQENVNPRIFVINICS